MQMKIDYHSDVFFKYAFGRESKESNQVREFLLRKLLPVSADQLIVKNPEIIPSVVENKDIVLDIYMKSERIEVDIEIQTSLFTQYIYKRFQYYGARMLASQLHVGEDYRNLKNTYQLILIEDIDRENPKLMETFHFKQHIGERKLPHYIHTIIYVYLPYIEKIGEEKEELNELEALLYLIHKGTLKEIKYKEEEGVIKMVEMLYSEFMGNDKLVEATMKRYLRKDNYQAWHDADVEEAKEISKQEILFKILTKKFPQEEHEWLWDCVGEQLDILSDLIITEDNYLKLKELVLNTSIMN